MLIHLQEKYRAGEPFVCSACGGIRGELPTWCPGVPMTENQRDQVRERRLDFRITGLCVADWVELNPDLPGPL